MSMAARRPTRIELPAGQSPWSWRVFADRHEAWRFFHRLQEGDPPPRRLDEPRLAPDGSFIPPGSWLVLYRPIIGAHPDPARIKPDAVNPAMIAQAGDAYVRSCDRYRKELRRLD